MSSVPAAIAPARAGRASHSRRQGCWRANKQGGPQEFPTARRRVPRITMRYRSPQGTTEPAAAPPEQGRAGPRNRMRAPVSEGHAGKVCPCCRLADPGSGWAAQENSPP
jgi:hypothetical protein